MTTISEYLAEQKRLAEAATEGPWAFAAAPAEGSEETPIEYLHGALTGDGPLFVVWVPKTEGDPGGYRLTAATGDGPHASMDAEFIAAARESVPRLVAALEAVAEMHAEREWRPLDGTYIGGGSCKSCRQPWPCPTIRAVEAALGGEIYG